MAGQEAIKEVKKEDPSEYAITREEALEAENIALKLRDAQGVVGALQQQQVAWQDRLAERLGADFKAGERWDIEFEDLKIRKRGQ